MTEAELIEIYGTARTQLDAAVAQLIALNFALIIGVYYFLHRSSFMMKFGIFLIYVFGWLTFISSAGFSGVQISGAAQDLAALQEAGPVSITTENLLDVWQTLSAYVYLAALNAVNFLMVISGFLVLFFWKPRSQQD